MRIDKIHSHRLEANRSYESLIVIHDTATLVLPERRPAFAELVRPARRPAAKEFITRIIEFIRAKMAFQLTML